MARGKRPENLMIMLQQAMLQDAIFTGRGRHSIQGKLMVATRATLRQLDSSPTRTLQDPDYCRFLVVS